MFGNAFASGATEGLNEAKLEVETYMLANRGLANGIATGLASTGVFTPQEVHEEAKKVVEMATKNIGIKIEPPKAEAGYVYIGHFLLRGEEPVSSDIPLCRLPPKQTDKFEIVEQMASGKNGEAKPVTIVYLYGVAGEETCDGEHGFDPYDIPVKDFDREAHKDANPKNAKGQSDGTGTYTPPGGASNGTGTGTATGTGANTYDYWYGIGSLNDITLTYDPTLRVMRTQLYLATIFPLKAKEVKIHASEICVQGEGTCITRTYKFKRPSDPSTGDFESSGYLEENRVSFELKGETAAVMPGHPREEDPVMLEIIFDTPDDLGFDVVHSYVNQGGQWVYRKPLQYGEFEYSPTNIPIYKVEIGDEN